MKRMFFASFAILAALICARPTNAAAGIDACYRGAAEAETHLALTVQNLANYAKLPHGEKTVAELVEETRVAVADAVACGVPNVALTQMTLPSLATKARLAHAEDAVAIAENTNHPPVDLLIAAMRAIDDAAASTGIDRAAIKKLNARLGTVVKNRLE